MPQFLAEEITPEQFEERLQEVAARFAAVADETERAEHSPRQHFRELAEIGAYRGSVPRHVGGFQYPKMVLWRSVETLAAACGVTQFIHAQIVAATNLIGFAIHDGREHLRPQLETFLSGEKVVASAVGQIRRSGRPALRARECPEGYRFEGVIPWFTAWDIADSLTLAAPLEDGRIVYVLASARDGALQAGPPMKLAAMQATQTVTVKVDDYLASPDQLLLVESLESMQRNHRSTIVWHAAQSLGLAQAAAELLDKQRASDIAQVVRLRCEQIRQRAASWDGSEDQSLEIRGAANRLGLVAAQTAVVACGGSSVLMANAGQRWVREAMFYFLTQSNESLRDAQLEGLVSLL